MNTSRQEILANSDVNVDALIGAREALYKTHERTSSVKHYVNKIIKQTLVTFSGTMYLK